MIARRDFERLLLLGLMAAAITGCDAGNPDATLRYRMTIEVETPDGVRQNSTVRELRFTKPGNGPSIGQSRGQIDIAGEAVVIDLPNGKTIFALLKGEDGDVDYASRIADRSGIWSEGKSLTIGPAVELWPEAPRTPQMANTSAVPMLVTFKDVNNPNSVVRVPTNDLASRLGAGYRLKSVRVEVTDQASDRQVGQKLPWLCQYRDKLLNGDEVEWVNKRELSAHLSAGSFTTRCTIDEG